MIQSEIEFLALAEKVNVETIKIKSSVIVDVVIDVSEKVFLEYAKKKKKEVFYSIEYPKKEEVLITGKLFEKRDVEMIKLLHEMQIGQDFSWYIDQTVCPEEYLPDERLSDEIMDEYFGEFEKELKSEILKYNDSINKEIFNYVKKFHAFIIEEGKYVGIVLIEKVPNVQLPEKAFAIICEENKEKMLKLRKEKEKKKENIRSELREKLLADKEFLLCTNQKLRADYAKRVWNLLENMELRKSFSENEMIIFPEIPTNEFFSFIELVYKEYKQR